MRGELLEDAVRASMRAGPRSIACSLAPPAIAGYALRAADRAAPRWAALDRRRPRRRRGGDGARGRARRAADPPLEDAGPRDGLALGLAQAVALIPGVSRSGATLTAARARGFARGDAQALSWHAALPVHPRSGRARGAPAGSRRRRQTGARRVRWRRGRAAFASTLASARVSAAERRAGGAAPLLALPRRARAGGDPPPAPRPQ